jgi:hypothetical protein
VAVVIVGLSTHRIRHHQGDHSSEPCQSHHPEAIIPENPPVTRRDIAESAGADP